MDFPSFQEIKNQLQEKTFAEIPLSLKKETIDEAVKSFMDFLALPQEIKKTYLYRILPQDRGSEVGYNFRERKLGNTDDREYVHYHEDAEKGFTEARKQQPELDALLTAMKPIYRESLKVAKKVIAEFEHEFPGISNKFFPEQVPPKCYLRLVAYNRHEPGDFLAIGHYDRGSYTLALAESSPGLRIGTSPEKVTPVTHKPEQAFFFPGIRFSEVTNNTYVAGWHDVIQKASDAFSDKYTRWALVLFIDSQEMTYVTWEQAHTPLTA